MTDERASAGPRAIDPLADMLDRPLTELTVDELMAGRAARTGIIRPHSGRSGRSLHQWPRINTRTCRVVRWQNLDRRTGDEPSDTRTEPPSGADAGAVLIKTQAVHTWSICTLGDYLASAAQTARV